MKKSDWNRPTANKCDLSYVNQKTWATCPGFFVANECSLQVYFRLIMRRKEDISDLEVQNAI
jgi:hypothetical protein